MKILKNMVFLTIFEETKIMSLLKNESFLQKTKISQLLLLFKMYKFDIGFLFLLEYLD